MPIRKRLMLNHTLLVALPIFILVVFTIISLFVINSVANRYYHIHFFDQHPVAQLTEPLNQVSNEVRDRIANSPDSLLDPQVEITLDAKLQRIGMGLVVLKKDTLVYQPRIPYFKEAAFRLESTSSISSPSTTDALSDLVISNSYHVVFTNGERGTISILYDLRGLRDLIVWFIYLAFLAIAALISISTLITLRTTKSIMDPLKQLQSASERMKFGDYESRIEVDSQDEFGQLGTEMELLRTSLVQSVELRHAYEAERNRLMTGISHDLKSPVAAIKGYVEGIRDGIANTPEKLDHYTSIIHAKSIQVERMIGELFEYAKWTDREMPLQLEAMDLIAFLEDVIHQMYVTIEPHLVHLRAERTNNERILIYADRERLQRVLQNLLDNAVKFMHREQGNIEIYVEQKDHLAIINVIDNGPGIPENQLPHIFDRFYRADISRNPNIGGTGLGLSIAKQIIDAHKGTIEAISTEGIGTQIKLQLLKYKKEVSSFETNIDHRG